MTAPTKRVPREPTAEMIKAGNWGSGYRDMAENWRVMHDAALDADAGRVAELERAQAEKTDRLMDRYGMQDGSLLRDLRARIVHLEAENAELERRIERALALIQENTLDNGDVLWGTHEHVARRLRGDQ